MRALAVSAPSRLDGIPSLKELGIDVVLGNWRGIFGAPGITTAQRDALVSAVKTTTESAAWKETLVKMGWENVFLGGDAFKAFVEEDTKRVKAILDSLGLAK
jgi:putative tricarboxylic transport membrane protein